MILNALITHALALFIYTPAVGSELCASVLLQCLYVTLFVRTAGEIKLKINPDSDDRDELWLSIEVK